MFAYFRKLLIPTGIILWSTWYYIEVMGKPKTAHVLVQPLFYLLLILYALICYTDYKEHFNGKSQSHDAADKARPQEKRTAVVTLGCMIAATAYLISMPYLGFIFSTIVFLAASFCFLGARYKLWAIAAAALLAIALNAVFKIFLEVPLPTGSLWA